MSINRYSAVLEIFLKNCNVVINSGDVMVEIIACKKNYAEKVAAIPEPIKEPSTNKGCVT